MQKARDPAPAQAALQGQLPRRAAGRSQYTDVAAPQGSDDTGLVQLDRGAYTEVR